MGIIARMVRSSLLDVMNNDYVRTARAKGLPERSVIGSHALRNALIPTVTVLGLTFGGLLAGAVFTETIFRWPGLGQYAVQTATKLDFAGILGVTLVVATVYILFNFVVDLLYGVLDPRIAGLVSGETVNHQDSKRRKEMSGITETSNLCPTSSGCSVRLQVPPRRH